MDRDLEVNRITALYYVLVAAVSLGIGYLVRKFIAEAKITSAEGGREEDSPGSREGRRS